MVDIQGLQCILVTFSNVTVYMGHPVFSNFVDGFE